MDLREHPNIIENSLLSEHVLYCSVSASVVESR